MTSVGYGGVIDAFSSESKIDLDLYEGFITVLFWFRPMDRSKPSISRAQLKPELALV